MRPSRLSAASSLSSKSGETETSSDKKKDEYWAAGTGYGHRNRSDWDVKAYLAAQKEKDRNVEQVLHSILKELRILYANHAPQLKPRNRTESVEDSVAIDPVEDVFTIIEGSALVPFIEQQLKADSFLEICRHTAVYKVIVDIIREITLQARLVPLLVQLYGQEKSLYELLHGIEQMATVLLKHICKAGNGNIPKGKKKEKKIELPPEPIEPEAYEDLSPSTSAKLVASDKSFKNDEEEKLARELVSLYSDVDTAIQRQKIALRLEDARPSHAAGGGGASGPADEEKRLTERYKSHMRQLQFDSADIAVDGNHAHNYASEFKKSVTPSQNLIFRVAQELSSLSSSLPLELSSSVFVRTDDERLSLMRAVITGPEGTPYSGGCYLFDIFFPVGYPKIPPSVNLQTTGNGTVRFNPNLYNCGKVCLSLLGTWEGQQGEQWNETTSTVLQVLVSIQSLILVPEPYYNEPGYEQEIGTEQGRKHSNQYNADVRINNIKYAILAQLQHPPKGFEAVIRSHFYLKRERLLQEVEEWSKTPPHTSKLDRLLVTLRSELGKLKLPQNQQADKSTSSK